MHGMTRARVGLGQRGETLAAQALARLGYEVVARNWHCPEGEVDIIARRGDEWYFVEVRTRRGAGYGAPEQSLTPQKQARMEAVALRYLGEQMTTPASVWHLSFVAVALDAGGRLERLTVYLDLDGDPLELHSMDTSRIPLVAIVGPTAVGKTGLAVTVGPRFGAEVVSADSRQLYRRMDIGTAKPTPAERAQLPHHLIDVSDPDETVSLARFLRLARAAIGDIAARGRLPLLVGGTGQYVRALLQGWQVPEVPPDPALRARLEAAAARDPQALWARLLALDPAAVDLIHPHNLRRIVRALEVTLKSGRPFSEQRRRIAPPYRVLQLGLTLERDALYARADARVTAMVAAGLLDEVRGLLEAGYDWTLPAMSGLGYIQLRPYLTGEMSLAEAVERIQLDTHDFIRRQYAWFSLQDPAIHWLDAATLSPEVVAERIAAFLAAGP